MLAAAFVALVAGLVMGHFINRRISAEHARRAVLALAVAGALGTVVKGAALLLN